MSNSLDTRALQMLRQKLIDHLNEAHENLGSGSQIIRDDAAATGMNFARYAGMISGLQDAMKYTQDVDDEINGKTPEE